MIIILSFKMMVTCEVCRIVLSENDLPFHNNGKKHSKNLVKMKILSTKITRTVTNSPLTSNVSNEKINLGHDSQSVKGADFATESTSVLKNEKVSITKPICSQPKTEENTTIKKSPKQHPEVQKQMQKRKRKDDSPKPPILPDVLVNNYVSFDQQVINFIMQVEQTANEWRNINWVLGDIEFTFSHVIPGVKPVLYGSSFSGLAFKTSDIDVYLYDPRGGEPDREFIQKNGSIIYKVHLFTNIIRIPSARVPVIKATHIETGIDVDISATSGQAVANSRMLRFLLSHDWRIRSLMILIGYFGKKYTLIGVNKFSRYSINLLIIFYLQNLSSPILPPLSHVVYGSPGRTWPFAFRENTFILMNNNKQSLAELFMEFFKFYLNFPFSNHVISTYCGEKITHEDMEKEEILDKMVYYKDFIQKGGHKIVFNCICVQDPFELSHNTTKGITEKVLQQLQFICTNVLQITQGTDEKYWINEMLTMDYVPPYSEKGRGNPVSFNIKYTFSGDDWITSMKTSLELLFWALGIEIDWNCPITEDDAKKMKLSPGLAFIIQTKKFAYPKGLKWCLNQLKLGNYNLRQFQKSVLEIAQSRTQTVFSAQCYVSLDQPNQFRITMKNNCYHKIFFNMIPILKNNFEMLLNLASQEKTKKTC